MRYWLETLGCPKNQVDSDKLAGTLRRRGLRRRAAGPETADLVVVNTCAFIEAARQESIDTILALSDARRPGRPPGGHRLPGRALRRGAGRRPARGRPGRRASACRSPWPPGDSRRRPGRPAGPVVRSAQPAPSAGPRRPGPTSRWPRVATASAGSAPSRRSGAASGPGPWPTSWPRSSRSGVEEIVLVAQDLASYGRDLGLDDRAEPPIERLVRGGVGPGGPDPAALPVSIRALRRSDRRHGCHRLPLLRPVPAARVAVPCCAACAAGATATASSTASTRIRACYPDAALRSSFIVGYPGETEEDHDQLLAFLAAAELDWAGFFPFSPEEGTYAAGLPDQVARRPGRRAPGRVRRAAGRHHGPPAPGPGRADASRVLVDEPGVARSHREAPEIDGVDPGAGGSAAGRQLGRRRGDRRRRSRPRRRPRSPAAGGLVGHQDRRENSSRRRCVTPANVITAVRLLATPPRPGAHRRSSGSSWAAALAWVAVASTDFLDGWVARRQGATTSGAFLDPLADKVLVLGALVALAATGLASWIPVVLIAGREVAISVYRSVVGPHGVSVPARPLAKLQDRGPGPGRRLDPAARRRVCTTRGSARPCCGSRSALAVVSGAQYLLDSRPAPAGLVARDAEPRRRRA